MSDRGTAHLYAIGEFDLLNSRTLEIAVRESLADGFTTALVDLGQVSFMDVSVVHALIRCWDRAAEHGAVVAVVNPSPTAVMILDACGTRKVLCPDWAAEIPLHRTVNRRTVIGRQPVTPDVSVAAVLEACELAIARANQVTEQSRRILELRRRRDL